MKSEKISITVAVFLVLAGAVMFWLGSGSIVVPIPATLLLVAGCILFITTSIRFDRLLLNEREAARNSRELLTRKLGQYEMLLENSPTVLCIKDEEGNYIYVNSRFEQEVNIQKDEILGRTAPEVLPPDIVKSDQDADHAALQTDDPVEYEIFLPDKEGNPKHLWVSKKRVSVKHTGESNIIGFAWDITRIKKTEDHLKRLLSALEQSPVSVLITDQQGNIEYVNSYFCTVSGYNRDELIGNKPSVLKSGHQPASYYKEMWKCILSGVVWKGDFINLRKNGEEYVEQAAIAPVYDDSGQISHFVGVKQDVTEQRNVQKNLEKIRLNAELANRAKNTFLAKMSRELRTPLNTIMGYTQILKEDRSISVDSANILDSIHRSGKDLIQVINNVLEMSRIESGKYELSKTSFRVESTLKDVIQMFSSRATEKGVKLRLKMAEELSPRIFQDEQKLRLVLSNLLRNAVNFTKSGRIELSYKFEMHEALPKDSSDGVHCLLSFEIKDTGIGIQRADHERIFESFEQAGDSKQLEGGSGLGLAISRHYARLMGGDVVLISSEPGKGSLFKAHIMADLSDEHEQTEILLNPGDRTQSDDSETHVLWLNTPGDKSKLVLDTLVERGYFVKTIDSLSQAEGLLHQHDIQYVVLEVSLLSMEEVDELVLLGKLMSEHGTTLIGLLDENCGTVKEHMLTQASWHEVESDGVFPELRSRLNYKIFSLVHFSKKHDFVTTDGTGVDASGLPFGVREEFLEAATTGELGKLRNLIRGLGPEFALLKEELHEKMNSFDFEAIIEAFKAQKDEDY